MIWTNKEKQVLKEVWVKEVQEGSSADRKNTAFGLLPSFTRCRGISVFITSFSLSPIPIHTPHACIRESAREGGGERKKEGPAIGTPPRRCACLANGNSRHCDQSLFCLSEALNCVNRRNAGYANRT